MKKIVIPKIKENLFLDEADKGLKIFMLPNKNVNKFYITLCVKYGSRYTTFKLKDDSKKYNVTNGIAHFLEHQMFYNEDGSSVHEVFAKLGSYCNAGTSYDVTYYEVFGTTFIEENITELLNYVYSPYFEKSNIENEKGIITEEILMYEDRPASVIFEQMNQNLFVKDKIRNKISGEISDIKKINKKELDLVYNTFYHPKNMFLIVTGNFNPDKIKSIVNIKLNNMEFDSYKTPSIIKEKEPKKVNKKETVLYMEGINNPKVKYSVKIPIKDITSSNIDINKATMILSLIIASNFGLTSDLREELKEKELILTYLVHSIERVDDFLVINLFVNTIDPNEIIKRINFQFNNIVMTKEELIRKKRVRISDYVLSYDDITGKNEEFIDNIIEDNMININIIKDYNNISMKDIDYILKKVDFTNKSIVIALPK